MKPLYPICIVLLACISSKIVCGGTLTSKSDDTSVSAIGSGVWTDPSVWSCACVPGANHSVLIADDHWVSIESDAHVMNLTIDSDGGMDFSWLAPVTLTIWGDMTCEGFIDHGFGTVLFASDNDQVMQGWIDLYRLKSLGNKRLTIRGHVNVFVEISSSKSEIYSDHGLHVWIFRPGYQGLDDCNGGYITGTVLFHGVLGVITESNWPTFGGSPFESLAASGSKRNDGNQKARLGSRLLNRNDYDKQRPTPEFKMTSSRFFSDKIVGQI